MEKSTKRKDLILIKSGSNPRRNLPPTVSRKRGESNFARAFERAYSLENVGCNHAWRDFPLEGYGIADLVWLSLNEDENNGFDSCCGSTVGDLVAFEFKLSDWKKAFSQAYRYSYYADRSVVVMPTDAALKASGSLHLFEKHSIALWSFDPKTSTIEKIFSPEETKARNSSARRKAVGLVLGKVDLCKAGK